MFLLAIRCEHKSFMTRLKFMASSGFFFKGSDGFIFPCKCVCQWGRCPQTEKPAISVSGAERVLETQDLYCSNQEDPCQLNLVVIHGQCRSVRKRCDGAHLTETKQLLVQCLGHLSPQPGSNTKPSTCYSLMCSAIELHTELRFLPLSIPVRI